MKVFSLLSEETVIVYISVSFGIFMVTWEKPMRGLKVKVVEMICKPLFPTLDVLQKRFTKVTTSM